MEKRKAAIPTITTTAIKIPEKRDSLNLTEALPKDDAFFAI
jgi:hypothetical protein